MWLKRSTAQNIVIGGAAGAFPPMIGWAAVTGSVGLETAMLFADHLPVDAAAFLGAGAREVGRLRARRRADAAERRRPRCDAPPDPALHAGARAARRCCRRRSALPARSMLSSRCSAALAMTGARRAVFSRRQGEAAIRAGAAAVRLLDPLSLRAVRGAARRARASADRRPQGARLVMARRRRRPHRSLRLQEDEAPARSAIIALALALGALVAPVLRASPMAKLGGNVLNRPL